VNLRAATREDAAAIAALEKLCFDKDAWSYPLVVAELSGVQSEALVSVSGSEVVGYALTMASGDVVDLLRIAVHPQWRRRGVAGSLLRAVLDRAAATEAERMLLEVRVGNTAARAFYQAAGFAEISRRPRYYRDGTDALVLALPLKDRPADSAQ
jgi:ribosomal-protein-alanine acetyltransferase